MWDTQQKQILSGGEEDVWSAQTEPRQMQIHNLNICNRQGKKPPTIKVTHKKKSHKKKKTSAETRGRFKPRNCRYGILSILKCLKWYNREWNTHEQRPQDTT